MMSELETAIMFVVFSSLYKMVKEFLRYLYSRNATENSGAKNDPTLPGRPKFSTLLNF